MTQIPPKSLVLYADDDRDDLMLVRDSFLKYSSNVRLVTVHDGVEAMDFLRHLDPGDPLPCLIILDMNMPRLSGKDVLIALRRMEGYEDVPVILFTTSSMPSDKAFAQKHSAGYITKPLNARQMEFIIDQFIDHCTEEVRKQIRRKD
ncbi:MAG TPA: response regulator [Chitinophagaceae bacterium]|nr:response regulator [Chitinophagaceae bacterium]